MFCLVVMEGMTLQGHLSNINDIILELLSKILWFSEILFCIQNC